MTPTPQLLRVQAVHAGYGRTPVLFGVDLQLGPGEIVGLLGRNGMGKTTLVRSVMGLIAPSAGAIEFSGASIAAWPAHRVARLGLALVPEGRQVFGNLSVEEHLSAFERNAADAKNPWTPLRLFELFPRLAQRRDHLGGQLSGGEQQMLAIGRGLMAEPLLLILDEPSLGLSPLLVDEMFTLIRRLHDEGLAVLLVEQNVAQSLEIAQRAYVLENGSVRFAGLPAELLASDELRRAYLGL